ncbi:BMP family ABC transporter substrate-binding protein [Actinospica sp.]|uniref:BMP family lipoprotein n=1 Tax=Actinospica sp. TaxID=1872142 RepID=UPI002BE231CF|nr:BMP family ABC transporter substrate-binding protein [Actinospica sp.]HWG23866.1 BMP family ABC transporter substrate-binding protein [Actinospica sp.]
MKKSLKLAAALSVVGLAASACGSAPVSTTSTSSASSFSACMVTDTGGIDDHSFNAESWAGMQDAASASSGKIGVSYVQSTTENDYTSNISSLVGKGCKMIVTVGFAMADATTASSKKNPSQEYAIVDNASSGSKIQGLQFNTAQGAFLGGYFAAGMTKTGKVATFGGAKYPTVTVYMDGFWEGVQYYNQKHGTSVQVLGWSEKSQQGTFDTSANPFGDQSGGKSIAQTFQSQGADIVFPVAGGTGIGALQAAQASGGKMNAIWVDDDGFYSNSAYAPVIMTSVTKGIATAVKTSVTDAYNGKFTATSFIGTLANNGTGLAPYHDFTSKVPAALTSELSTVKAGIISGTIKITSTNQPTA